MPWSFKAIHKTNTMAKRKYNHKYCMLNSCWTCKNVGNIIKYFILTYVLIFVHKLKLLHFETARKSLLLNVFWLFVAQSCRALTTVIHMPHVMIFRGSSAFMCPTRPHMTHVPNMLGWNEAWDREEKWRGRVCLCCVENEISWIETERLLHI